MSERYRDVNIFLKRLQAIPKLCEVNYRYTSVSLFSGGGGLDLGLALAGFRTKFATDSEQPHCQTISHNFLDCLTEAIDVQRLTGKKIKEVTKIEEFDLVAGGPPCQAFSILGKRESLEDPRGQLVFDFIRLVQELSPKAFLFENVPGLMTVNKGKDWENLLKFFEESTGYKIFYSILNAADFGIPQIRKRIFIVGFKSKGAEFEFPHPTHHDINSLKISTNSKSKRSWWPAYFALEDVDTLPNHRLRPHGERVRNRYLSVPQGGRDKVDHTDRIDPCRPSGTVLVGSRAGGGRPFIHPFEPRHITVREAARLQSFPDWYIFQGTETWQYRAVGNAVPPILARAVGRKIALTLDKLQESNVNVATLS